MSSKKLYVVTYTANDGNDHEIDSCYHTKIFEKKFTDLEQASRFLSECTSSQKNLSIISNEDVDITPELRSFVDSDGIELYY